MELNESLYWKWLLSIKSHVWARDSHDIYIFFYSIWSYFDLLGAQNLFEFGINFMLLLLHLEYWHSLVWLYRTRFDNWWSKREICMSLFMFVSCVWKMLCVLQWPPFPLLLGSSRGMDYCRFWVLNGIGFLLPILISFKDWNIVLWVKRVVIGVLPLCNSLARGKENFDCDSMNLWIWFAGSCSELRSSLFLGTISH